MPNYGQKQERCLFKLFHIHSTICSLKNRTEWQKKEGRGLLTYCAATPGAGKPSDVTGCAYGYNFSEKTFWSEFVLPCKEGYVLLIQVPFCVRKGQAVFNTHCLWLSIFVDLCMWTKLVSAQLKKHLSSLNAFGATASIQKEMWMPSNQRESDFVESPQPEPNGNIGGLILKGKRTTTLASHQPHLVKKNCGLYQSTLFFSLDSSRYIFLFTSCVGKYFIYEYFLGSAEGEVLKHS